MSGETDGHERTIRFSIWAWPSVLITLIGPSIIVGALTFIVHLARPGSGTMFDDENFDATMVGVAVAVVAVVIGGYVTRSMVRTVVLRGPCPNCGAVAVRQFENPADPKSAPTACGFCIVYLRANGNELREEALDAATDFGLNYALSADQYMPAVKRTNRRYFKFDMPTMCAYCGDPNAPCHRDIGDGDTLGTDPFEVLNKGHVLPQVGMAPGVSKPTEDDENSRGLSKLTVPVCAKHTEAADGFLNVLKYSSGKLEFASYRYYKAFCELNKIEHAPVKRRG